MADSETGRDSDVMCVPLDVWRRCNSVAPGVTLTRAAYENLSEEHRAEFLDSVPSSRLGAPDDIAAMVAFLLSDDGAYVNGRTILVDGGRNFT